MDTQIHQKRSVMFGWERIWRAIGIVSLVLFIIAYVIYGSQPKVGAWPWSSAPFTMAIARGS